MTGRLSAFNAVSLILGFTFLYLPILLLVAFSFNESRLVVVWTGFSTRWYGELFQNQGYINAAWVTIRVALVSSTLATVLGTLAAVALTRGGRFRGRTLFSGMVYAPLVMPEVITGLSLLLLFVAIGFDRGFWTVTAAHVTFSMCYAAVVVSSRLITFDRSLEEAARDLGSPPWKAFVTVTLPVIAPAIIAAWLLSFTLSLDDLVIASFTTGPGATTLPMKVYSAIRLGVSPEINALCTLLVGVVAIWRGCRLAHHAPDGGATGGGERPVTAEPDAFAEERARFLESNPDIEQVEVLLTDLERHPARQVASRGGPRVDCQEPGSVSRCPCSARRPPSPAGWIPITGSRRETRTGSASRCRERFAEFPGASARLPSFWSACARMMVRRRIPSIPAASWPAHNPGCSGWDSFRSPR